MNTEALEVVSECVQLVPGATALVDGGRSCDMEWLCVCVSVCQSVCSVYSVGASGNRRTRAPPRGCTFLYIDLSQHFESHQSPKAVFFRIHNALLAARSAIPWVIGIVELYTTQWGTGRHSLQPY